MNMQRSIRRLTLLAASFSTFVFGSCVTNTQLYDFGRTEVARIISDTFGQFIFNSLLAGSTNASNFQ
jgi:hypothetical protein